MNIEAVKAELLRIAYDRSGVELLQPFTVNHGEVAAMLREFADASNNPNAPSALAAWDLINTRGIAITCGLVVDGFHAIETWANSY
ncbi:hypothetical protein [Nocardia sp. NRRL S-836]|uniref:hypothetical protein n=1 Tax=Nocardia sp. NRRL S-836 TaxID=1519492 RepID=UPI0012FB894C|nr:hypothetical protein [Nocardia sp. NRRL S-836]